MLFSNLHLEATNRLISPDFGLTRQTCRQRCQEDSRCRYCYHCLEMAQEDKIRQIKEQLEKKDE
jgi:hypothetical protein